jgi:pimeloyl-ACP methyl ester carboxylesterase
VKPVPDELVKAWVAPLLEGGVRRDARKVFRAISAEHTLAAAEGLRSFDRPALIVWGTGDRFFSFHDAKRLADVLPNAHIERIEGARTFVQLDAPDRVADLLATFVRTGAPVST